MCVGGWKRLVGRGVGEEWEWMEEGGGGEAGGGREAFSGTGS